MQMTKVILSYKFDFYMMHVVKVSAHSYNIVNRNNQFKGIGSFLYRSFEQLQARLSHSMDSSGTRTYSYSVSIVIVVVSSARTLFGEEVNRLSSVLKFIH